MLILIFCYIQTAGKQESISAVQEIIHKVGTDVNNESKAQQKELLELKQEIKDIKAQQAEILQLVRSVSFFSSSIRLIGKLYNCVRLFPRFTAAAPWHDCINVAFYQCGLHVASHASLDLLRSSTFDTKVIFRPNT